MFRNLTQQLTAFLAMCIFLTATAAILPVYALIRNELQRQVEQRLEDAQQNSRIILRFEQAQLQSTVGLAAERPTLRQLLSDPDPAALTAYLREFQRNTDLDYLYVSDVAGRYVAGLQPDTGEIRLESMIPIEGGWRVTGAVRLDEAFAARLKQQTSFTYHFLPSSGQTGTFNTTVDGQPYLGDVLPISGTTQPRAVMEILLPIEGLLAVETQVIVLLLGTTLVVTLIASLGGAYFVRQRLRPLRKLTVDANQLGQGHLETPIYTPSETLEIRSLAEVLETSRVRLARTLKAYAQAKEWSESLIRSINEGIITFDQRGHIVFCNEGAARIVGLNSDEIEGRAINSLFTVTSEASARFTDFVPSADARRTVSVRTPKRDALSLAVTRARQPDDDQTTIVLHDITEETQRRNLQTYFLANVSHEFRTPLAGMKVSIELLLENYRFLSHTEINDLLNSLHLSITTLHSLIDNLLESTRIEANHLSLRRQPSELNALLADAIRLVQPFLNRREQSLNLDEPLTLPTMHVDPTRLIQVLVNLLSNASKYSPMAAQIDLRVENRGQSLYVAVADRGKGIPESEREDVFKQFVRLGRDSADPDHGAGVGLAVVKAIIEAHGGQVGVEARDGGGSIFWFDVPVNEK